jgi:transposase-like protein
VTARTRRRHSAEFQANAVRKLSEPGQSAQELADELEVRPSLLYRWRRAAQAKEGPMPKKKPPPTNEPSRRPQDWTTEQKLAVVLGALHFHASS